MCECTKCHPKKLCDFHAAVAKVVTDLWAETHEFADYTPNLDQGTDYATIEVCYFDPSEFTPVDTYVADRKFHAALHAALDKFGKIELRDGGCELEIILTERKDHE